MIFKRLVVVGAGLAMPVAAFAHHAFAAEYSRDLPIEVTGQVTKVEWMNPHARFYVDAEDANGETVHWDFELTSPNVLMRQGWSRSSMNVGDTVTVTGFRARNHPHVGNVSSVKLANGKEVFARPQ